MNIENNYTGDSIFDDGNFKDLTFQILFFQVLLDILIKSFWEIHVCMMNQLVKKCINYRQLRSRR